MNSLWSKGGAQEKERKEEEEEKVNEDGKPSGISIEYW